MISINADQLKSALAFIAKAYKRTQVVDYQKYVLLIAESDEARLVFFDGSRELSTSFEADFKDDFSIAIDFEKLNARLSLTDDSAEVKISQKDEKSVQLKVGRSSLKLSCFPVSSYPRFQLKEEGTLLTVDASELKKAFSLVKVCAPTQDSRPYLNGVCFDVVDGHLTLVASDGRRLNKFTLDNQADVSNTFRVILPTQSVNAVMALLTDGECQIYITQSKIIFNTDQGTIKDVQIDRPYPDWRKAISKDCNAETTFNVIDFRQAIKLAMVTSNEFKFYAVVLDIKKDQAVISSSDNSGGETIEVVECSSNEEYQVAISGRYLDQVLPSIDSSNVSIKYKTNGGQQVIIVDGEFMATIMHIKI